jgi:hypothetical protein
MAARQLQPEENEYEEGALTLMGEDGFGRGVKPWVSWTLF